MFEWIRHGFAKKILLRDPAFGFLYQPDRSGELVALDCETTGLDVFVDDIISIGAIRICGNRIVTSECLQLIVRPQAPVRDDSIVIHRLRPIDVASGMPIEEALTELLHFIGSRPLVGYYLEFDVTMINKYLWEWLGVSLPNKQIEVSGMYYDWKFKQQPGRYVDLRFDKIIDDLNLPEIDQHDAFNDALMAAMVYLKLLALSGKAKDRAALAREALARAELRAGL